MMRDQPPGPRFSLLQTALYLRDPYGYYEGLQRRYGDPFFVPIVFGDSVMSGDTEAARALIAAPPELFSPSAEFVRPLAGDNSVLLSESARHKAQRKVFMPPMNGARMRAYGRLMQDVARAIASRWEPGRPLTMLREMQEISLLVIIHAIFGVTEGERVARFRDAVLEKTRAFTPYLALFPALRRDLGGYGPWARYQRASDRLEALLYEEMDRRRAEGRYGEDILSLLLNARYDDGSPLEREDLRDNLITLLIGGHETTASTLAWAFYWTHLHIDKLERVCAEVEALGPTPEPDAVARLPYLDAVCNESLRINPIAPSFGRILAQEYDFKGYRLRPGLLVSIATSLIHYREDLYPDPYAFVPERFLERSYGPHEFMPFGGGFRRCLGAAFAFYEMKQVLAAILPRHRLTLATRTPERSAVLGVTMGPERGVEMRLVERRKSADPPRAPLEAQ
jgi:cytochrome P450